MPQKIDTLPHTVSTTTSPLLRMLMTEMTEIATTTALDPSKPLSRSFCQRFFLSAVRRNHTFVVAEILRRGDIDVNFRSKHGQTALSLAAERGYVDIISLLLWHHSVDVNAQDTDGQTALGWAVFKGHIKAVSTLLENTDVRIDTADVDGMTPVCWAVAKKRDYIVGLLFERLGIQYIPIKNT